MNTNKTITIRGGKYKMYQVASTGWVFVKSNKTGRGYPIGKVADGESTVVEAEEALRHASNQELLEAWVASE